MFQLNTSYPLMVGKKNFKTLEDLIDFFEQLLYQSNEFIDELTIEEKVLMRITGHLSLDEALELCSVIEFKDTLERLFSNEKGFINQKEFYGIFIATESEKRATTNRTITQVHGMGCEANRGTTEKTE